MCFEHQSLCLTKHATHYSESEERYNFANPLMQHSVLLAFLAPRPEIILINKTLN